MSNEKSSAPVEKAPEMAEGDSGYVKWGGVAKEKKSFGDGEKKGYLERVKFEENVLKKLRIVSKPYKFWRHYDPIMAISPGFSQDPCWQAGNRARERYAVLVLDRTDENKLKILEGGPKVFSAFAAYFELSEGKCDPGGKKAPEWAIKVTIPPRMKDGRPVKDKRNTTYEVHSVPGTDGGELSAEEVAYVKANWVKLEEVYKPLSAEIIAEMFEDAKKMGAGDPVPGSGDWWKARREDKEDGGGKSNDAGTYAQPKAESPFVPVVDDSNIGVGESFDSLFPGDGDGDGGNIPF